MASEHYQEQLWDYVYGLLDEADAQSVRAHIETCTACRAALAKVEAGRQKLAQAARVIRDVPLFHVPGHTEPATPATIPLAPVSLPMPALRRARPRRYWLAVAAAAVLLAAAVGVNHFYQSKLQLHEAQVAKIRGDIAAFDGRFAALQVNLEQETRQKARQLEEQAPPLLQVLGSVQVQSGTTTNFNVATRDVNGALKPTTITTQLVDPKTNTELHKQVDRLEGEGNVVIPALKGGQREARVVMEAKAAKSEARVEETLRVAEQRQSSHLALNKSLYAVGDVALFRSLTLNQYNLTPPPQPVPLRYTLLDNNGRAVRELAGTTNEGGIGAGALALTPDLASGAYSLQVSAAAGSNYQMIPETRRLELMRGEAPQIAFDRNLYKPGEQFGINFRAGQAANSYANQKVNISVIADNMRVPQGAARSTANLDRAGNLNNFQLQLPAQIKNGAELVIDLKNGAKPTKLVQAIPVVSSERTIDFFPEGGDLVAGLPNRVYYRVRSPQGDFVQPDGHVIVRAGKSVLYDSKVGHGLGVFTFTPQLSETYSVRITGPQGLTEIAAPFQSLGIRSQGLVLHAPQPVSGMKEPMTLTLRDQGAPKRLLLQATCRGQVVDQQYVDMPAGTKEVKLQPSAGSAGIVRVTAFEVAANRLLPLAERLLFRIPDKRLDVACRIVNGPGPYAAGSKMALKLKVTDEHQGGGPTWMLAAVIDDKYLADKRETSLATHFYVANDLGEGLDGANLALTDAPASRQALDLFLGTHGWRRFAPGAAATALAFNEEQKKGAAAGNAVVSNTLALDAGFFSVQNTTQRNLQDTYRTELQKAVSELVAQANRERADLADQKEMRSQALADAVRELARFQQSPREYGRLALGILTLALLACAVVLLAFGLIRLARRQAKSPTAYFAGAFGCLGVCLVLYAIGGQIGGSEESRFASVADKPRNTWPVFSAEGLNRVTAAGEINAARTPLASAPIGTFMTRAPQSPTAENKQTPAPPSAVAQSAPAAELLAKRSDGAPTRGVMQNGMQAQNAGVDAVRRQTQNAYQGNSAASQDQMSRRFADAAARYNEKERAATNGPAPAAMPQLRGGAGAGGFGGGSATTKAIEPGAKDAYLREFAYHGMRSAGQLGLQDTLYWHPALFSTNGEADVNFDLPHDPGTYRILIYANSPSGRLGFYEGHFEVRAERK